MPPLDPDVPGISEEAMDLAVKLILNFDSIDRQHEFVLPDCNLSFDYCMKIQSI